MAPAHYTGAPVPVATDDPQQSDSSSDITTDTLESVFSALPADGELEWQGGTAVSEANDPDGIYQDNVADPELCLVFFAAEHLAMPGDAGSGRGDVLMTSTLVNPHGPGYDDNDWYAKVTIRLLNDPALATSELLDPMSAAAPQCSSYLIDDESLDWRITDVHSLELQDNVDIHPSASRAQVAVVDEDALEYGNTSWAIALVDNALVFVAYYGGDGAPFPDETGASTLMEQVLSTLAAERDA
jgi:hypothetical protein